MHCRASFVRAANCRASFVRAANCRAGFGHRERFRAGFGRSGASECPNVARKQVIVQMSPENEAVSESRPTAPRCSDLAQKHRGERAEGTRTTNGPRAAHGGLYATRTPFHASHSAQNAPVNPLNLPSTEARNNLFASRCRRQLPGSDSVQIHVRYLSDTSAFSLLAYLTTNER